MSTAHQLRDQTLALVFQLSWSAKRNIKQADSYVKLSAMRNEDASSEEASDAMSEPDMAASAENSQNLQVH